jgi:uncharacterized protein YbjT (DUF2867 family)
MHHNPINYTDCSKLRIMLTGASGFVGEGVLLAALTHPAVEEVLMINRRHQEIQHTKLKELIVPDLFQIESFQEHLGGYNTCFFCAGISSVGMNEESYTSITYDMTMQFAQTLLTVNPAMIFNFISGSHTDSSEKGKVMWARIKGKTENALMKLPFQNEYNFRPGGMLPVPGQQHVKPLYKFIVKVMKFLIPKKIVSLQELGLAMINAAIKGYPKKILEIADIKELAGAGNSK